MHVEKVNHADNNTRWSTAVEHVAYVVLDTMAEEIDEIAHSWRPAAEASREAAWQATAEASAVDVCVDWACAGRLVDADLRSTAQEGNQIGDGCEYWVQRKIVASDAHNDRVMRRDTFTNQRVLA